ncbi:MAG: sensor domain-containing diguanylate cyclase [Candidatus Zhuqueibacterota bacterium]
MQVKLIKILKLLVLPLLYAVIFLIEFLIVKSSLAVSAVVPMILIAILLYFGFHFFSERMPVIPPTIDRSLEQNLSENFRLVNRKLRKQIYDLHNLFEISVNLTSILEPKQLVSSLLPSLVGQLQTAGALVFLPNVNEETVIHPVSYKGYSAKQVEGFSLNLKDPIFNTFLNKKVAIDLKKLDKQHLDDRFIFLIEHGVQLIAPLVHKSKIKGIIALAGKINQDDFSQAETEMFTLFSNLISVAFSNAILYQELEKISITDEMTGLNNYRFFRKQFEDELSRARRFNHLLSFIIFDVDYFKNYNDTLGHPAGDEILRRVSELLKMTIRQSDIAARYGGEEFCIILPEEDVDGAMCFAERFRKKIEHYPFPSEEVQPGGNITISIGISCFPSHANTVQELINKADVALYHAKRNGRNKTCLYAEDMSDEESSMQQ